MNYFYLNVHGSSIEIKFQLAHPSCIFLYIQFYLNNSKKAFSLHNVLIITR